MQPPITAARAANSAAGNPWARRAPNSITPFPAAACTTRAALLATSV